MEYILSIAALTKGLYTVVAYSLLGSVLSNLLLVLGACTIPSSFLVPSFSAICVHHSCL